MSSNDGNEVCPPRGPLHGRAGTNPFRERASRTPPTSGRSTVGDRSVISAAPELLPERRTPVPAHCNHRGSRTVEPRSKQCMDRGGKLEILGRRRRSPVSVTITANCSAKRGLPSAVDAIRSRRAGVSFDSHRVDEVSSSRASDRGAQAPRAGTAPIRDASPRAPAERCRGRNDRPGYANEDDVLDQVEHRRLRPVEVFEADHHGPRIGRAAPGAVSPPRRPRRSGSIRSDLGGDASSGRSSTSPSSRPFSESAATTFRAHPDARTNSTRGQYVMPSAVGKAPAGHHRGRPARVAAHDLPRHA